jgi:hypothetical protein
MRAVQRLVLLLAISVIVPLQTAGSDVVPGGSGPWLVVDDEGRALGGVLSSSIESDSISVHVWIETLHGPGVVTLMGSVADAPNGGLVPMIEDLNLWFTSTDCSGTPYFIPSGGSLPYRYRNADGAWVFVGGPTGAVYSSIPSNERAETVRSWIPYSSGVCAPVSPTLIDALPLTPEGDLGLEFSTPFAIVGDPGAGSLVSALGGKAQAMLALALVLMLAFRGRARPIVATAD